MKVSSPAEMGEKSSVGTGQALWKNDSTHTSKQIHVRVCVCVYVCNEGTSKSSWKMELEVYIGVKNELHA